MESRTFSRSAAAASALATLDSTLRLTRPQTSSSHEAFADAP